MPCSYSNSGAPGAAASEHIAVDFDHWLLLNHVGVPRGTRLLNSTKTTFKSCPDTRALDFCGLKGQWNVAFDHSFRPYIYIYIYMYYTAYMYAG